MKISFTCCLLLFCALCRVGYSQNSETERAVGIVYLGGTFAQPLGNYRQAYPHGNAFGGTFGLLLNPLQRPSPLELGLQISYLSQGVNKRTSNFSTVYPTQKTSHSIVPLHAVAMVRPLKQMRYKPYVTGLAGMSVFSTRTKLKEDLFDFMKEEHEPIVLNKHRSTVISYGIGAGILFRKNKSGSSYADLRVTYLQSPLTNYVKKGQVSVQQDGLPAYSFTWSETNMLLINLNIAGILEK